MSRLILLANFVASWEPNPASPPAKAAYIRDKLGISAVHVLDTGWVLGIKPLPRTAANEVSVQSEYLVLLQGARSMAANTAAGANELNAMADRMRSRPHELGQHGGDYAAVMLQARGEYILVNTPASLPPLYFAHDGETVTLASRLDWIAKLRPVPPAVDQLPLALWGVGAPLHLDGRTVVRGISRMRRGSRLRHNPRAASEASSLTDAFLGKPGADRCATREDVAAALRQQVHHALETELIPDGGNLLSLSGGTDSSALAAIVNRMGCPFKAISVLSSDPRVREHELTYIRSALGPRYPDDWIEIPWRHREYQAEALEKAPPILHPVIHPVLCELQDIRRQHSVEVYLGGEFCDELIGGSAAIPEWCADTPLWRAWQQTPLRLQARTLSYSGYLRQRLRLALRSTPSGIPTRLPDFIEPALRREYRDWLARFGRTATTQPAELPLQRWDEAYTPVLDMNWEAASSVHVRRSFPLAGRAILGLLRRTAPALRLGPGPKALFRMAFAGDAPTPNLLRDDKGALGDIAPWLAKPTWVLRGEFPKGMISAGKVGSFSLAVGTGLYALGVIERYTNSIRTVLRESMNQHNSNAVHSANASGETERHALYEAPRIERGGNLSVVTKGTGTGSDTLMIGSGTAGSL